MDRTLTFSLLDDGSMLVEFKNVTSTSTMSMRAKDIRACPYIDLFIGSAKAKSNMADLCETSAEGWRADAERKAVNSQAVVDQFRHLWGKR